MLKTTKQHFSQRIFVIAIVLLFCLCLAGVAVYQKQPLSKPGITSSIDSQSDIYTVNYITDSQLNNTNGLMTTDSESIPVATQQTDEQTKAKALESYGQLPLHFEPNNGQIDNNQVRFSSRGQGYNLFLSPTRATLALRQAVNDKTKQQKKKNPDFVSQIQSQQVKAKNQKYKQTVVEMQIVGANKLSESIGTDELEGKSNYFIGNDKSKWRTDVANYKRVRFEEVYKGINLEYYGNQRQLEYDFIVAPNADPKQIKLKFEGVKKVATDNQSGELILKTSLGEVRQKKPFVYQTNENGEREEIASKYKIKGKEVSFELAEYDRTKQLVIDPVVLVYSSFLGGVREDRGTGVAVDAAGNAYVFGDTNSTNFPIANARQSILGSEAADTFITKINSSGGAFVYSTYLGGNSYDGGAGIAVDAAGNAYIIGSTKSTNFPTANARQATYGDGDFDAFITKLNSTGSALVYSTYHGGSKTDFGDGIAVDAAGNAYVTGQTSSANFPIANARQATYSGGGDAFITKFNSTGSEFVYSTYHGGNENEYGRGIAVDTAGNAYVTGQTSSSTTFPIANAYQATYGGGDEESDAFITKINSSGSALVYSTYLGGSGNNGVGDAAYGIAVDIAGNAYVVGFTNSVNFPTVNARQATYGGGTRDAFITKINSSGSTILYSTYLGGYSDETRDFVADYAYGIAVDAVGNAYVTGTTSSTNFPIANARQATFGGRQDAFITKINSTGSEFVYSTYHGGSNTDHGLGIAVDNNGNAYITGDTVAVINFPLVNNLQPTFGGGSYDAFISKFADGTPCSAISISVDQSLAGSLATSDCVINDRYVDTFTFSGIAGEQIAFSSDSSEFDSYLVLLDSNEKILLENNDGGGGINARLPLGEGFFTLPSTGIYSVRVTSYPSIASASASDPMRAPPGITGSFSAKLTKKPFNCSYSLSPTSNVSLSPTAISNQTFTVNTTANCGWTALKNTTDSWITINDNPSMSGTGAVSFSVEENKAAARIGVITVGGQTFTINQAAADSCVYSTSPLEYRIGPNGGKLPPVRVVVKDNCQWTATSANASMLTVINNSGSGNGFGLVELEVSLNPTSALRTGTISINNGSTVFSVFQDFTTNNSNIAENFNAERNNTESNTPNAVSCSYSVTPATKQVNSSENEINFTLNAAAGCAWTAISNASAWLEIINEKDGSGTRPVEVRIKANTTGVARTGTITVAGQTFTVNQAAGTIAVPRRTAFDFDGDNKTDLSIFRPAVGEWWYLRSSDGSNRTFQFGNSSDKLVPADYTGDGKTDVAFWRPSTGEWFIMRSENNSFFSFPFGASGDVPAPADYDADGKADAAVFRPSSSTWFISLSSGGTTIQQFGIAGDVPTVADYDGDGKADIAIYRPSQGQWWILRSSAGVIAYQFGSSADKPVQGDYTGDGKTDVAFFRPSTNEWFILRSENNSFYSFPFGASGDAPSPGDYDGDGKADAAIFRPSSNTWFAQHSTSGTLIQAFGIAGDKPIPNTFIP